MSKGASQISTAYDKHVSPIRSIWEVSGAVGLKRRNQKPGDCGYEEPMPARGGCGFSVISPNTLAGKMVA
jgi:hypothetical protein